MQNGSLDGFVFANCPSSPKLTYYPPPVPDLNKAIKKSSGALTAAQMILSI